MVAEADLNADGKVDLVIGNRGTGTVQIMLGNGNGTFQLGQPTGAAPMHSCAVADVNGDGIPDLVLENANYGFNDVVVLIGDGDGAFQNPTTLFAGSWPRFVAVGDLNGDGKQDLIVANWSGSNVSVFLGNGNGTFQPQQFYSVGNNPYYVAVADVNGDNKSDLIVANAGSNTISILLGNGDGTFQPQETFSTGSDPASVAVADVNGDGKPDLVVANYGGTGNGSVGILLGNGNGTFAGQQALGQSIKPSSVAVADIDGDGRPDIVACSRGGGNISLFLGNGNGTFASQHNFDYGHADTLVVADLNGDGHLDFATSDGFDIYLFVANGNGNFTGQVYTIVPADTIVGTSGNDSITLTQNSDGTDIDWSMSTSSGRLPISDSNGLTINGNGGSDTITLNYGAGNNNPLPNIIHLNGNININGLAGSNPLANTTLEIERSTVYISYSSSDPLSLIQDYLKAGYNNGAWNGTPTASTGAITSTPAASNAAQTTAIGYADSADGLIAGQPANTIELKYTLYGDTALTGTVGFNDFTRMTQHWNQTTGGTWETGEFN
jgi:hypothetical protein